MIKNLLYYISDSYDPYENLATEYVLTMHVPPDTCILFLWQNENTVVVGRNQNCWKECYVNQIEADGGKIARRFSGGGAVYHDLGNLNFTILLPREQFDLPKQMEVIRAAAESVGVEAVLSGRNDVLASGRKFSGNAFYKGPKAAYHHGTLLIHADMDRLGRYLSPDRKKLRSKGVDSVPSRVVNLEELAPGLTVEAMKQAMTQAFAMQYGGPEPLVLTEAELEEIRLLAQRNQSWQWNYGRKLPFDMTWEERFPWGGIEIHLQVEQGRVAAAKVYTDAMDPGWAPRLEQRLTGSRFTAEELWAAAEGLPVAEDLRQLIQRQQI